MKNLLLGLLGIALVGTPLGAQVCDLTETTKLIALDPEVEDYFGDAVAIDGDTAVVGAFREDASGNNAGAAYVFTRAAGVWTQAKKLLSSDGTDLDFFGAAVGVHGDHVFVGASGDDDHGSSSGAVYVFQRDLGGPGNWGEVKLTASDGSKFQVFGSSLAASGDSLLVGAPGDDGTGSGIGAVYVFDRNQGGADNWGQVVKRTGADSGDSDGVGISVGIDGDTFIASASGNLDRGAAYVFQRDQGGADNWGQVRKLTASDLEDGDQFGLSVAIGGDSAIVSAPFESTALLLAGKVYFFERDAGGADNWGEVASHQASDAEIVDQLGLSVAISGDVALAGTKHTDDAGLATGSAYIFRRDLGGSNNWGESGVLRASDAASGDNFGEQVALDGDTAIAGAPQDWTPDPASGSAYISSMGAAAEVVRLGSPPNPNAFLPGQTSGPIIGAVWDPVIDHSSFVPGASFDLLGLGFAPANIPLAGLGTLLCDIFSVPPITFLVTAGVPFSVALPNDCTLVGVTLCTQGLSLEGFNLVAANALDITIGMY